VGNSLATKKQIIHSFVKQLEHLENPLITTELKSTPLPAEVKPSYADMVRGNSNR
jgi:hypothetical protein